MVFVLCLVLQLLSFVIISKGQYFRTFSQTYKDLEETCTKELNEEGTDEACTVRCMLMKQTKISDSGEPNLDNFPHYLQESVAFCHEQFKDDEQCARELSMMKCVDSTMNEAQKKIGEDCERETGISLPNMARKKTAKLSTRLLDAYPCYYKCYFMKEGKLDDTDELLQDGFEDMWGNSKDADIGEAIKKCKGETVEGDQCVVVVGHVSCILKMLKPKAT